MNTINSRDMHPLASIIPESNQFHLCGASKAENVVKCQNQYLSREFAGCFLLRNGGWQKEIADFEHNEFLRATQPPHLYSDIRENLWGDEGDGNCVRLEKLLAHWLKDGKGYEWPLHNSHTTGIDVEVSGVQAVTQVLQKMDRLPSLIHHRGRGFGPHGWCIAGFARILKSHGWIESKRYFVDGSYIDLTTTEKQERFLEDARDFREFIPVDFDIVHFDGDREDLKTIFAAGGQLHYGSNQATQSKEPFDLGEWAPKAYATCGADWSSRTRSYYRDHGVQFADDDFIVVNLQTIGGGWIGETDDRFWAPWWGPKPPGAWVCLASQFMENAEAFAYIPKPTSTHTARESLIRGEIYPEMNKYGLSIRGTLAVSDIEHVAVPGKHGYKFVPK